MAILWWARGWSFVSNSSTPFWTPNENVCRESAPSGWCQGHSPSFFPSRCNFSQLSSRYSCENSLKLEMPIWRHSRNFWDPSKASSSRVGSSDLTQLYGVPTLGRAACGSRGWYLKYHYSTCSSICVCVGPPMSATTYESCWQSNTATVLGTAYSIPVNIWSWPSRTARLRKSELVRYFIFLFWGCFIC